VEIKKILFRKEMKLITLLLTSLLIATASASVYYSLTWQPRVTTVALIVKFVSGADSGNATVNDSWARLYLKSYPNATLTYEKGLNISNTDTLAAHRVSLEHVSITPTEPNWDIGNFTRIKFYLIAKNGTVATTFEYTTNGGNNWNEPAQTSYYWIPASEEWTLKIETLSPANAVAGKQANIQIALDVRE